MEAGIQKDTNTEALQQQGEPEELLLTPQDITDALISWPALFIYVTLLGAWVRVWLANRIGFPLNDGLFALDLARAVEGQAWPLAPFMTYNGQDVAFAHPPLAPYIAVFFGWLRDMTLIQTFTFYPMWISILSVPVFFIMATDMMGSRWRAFTATLVFAFTPSLLINGMYGSAVVTGTAQLLAMLTIWQGYLLIANGRERHLLPTALFLTLTAFTHGETTLVAVGVLVLLTVVFGRNRLSPLHLLLVLSVMLVALFVWLTPVLWLHGAGPFLGVFPMAKVGTDLTAGTLVAAQSLFTGEILVPMLTVIGVLGAFVALAKRNPFLPLWLAFTLLFFREEMLMMAALPLAMLVAVALHFWILPVLMAAGHETFAGGIAYIDYYSQRQWLRRLNERLYTLPAVLLVVLLAGYTAFGTVSALTIKTDDGSVSVSTADQEAFAWAAKNVRAQVAKNTKQMVPPLPFIVISGANGWKQDTVNAWFPLLAGNFSRTLVPGSGWYERFAREEAAYFSFEGCLNASSTDCLLEAEAAALGVTVEDILAGDVAPFYTHIYMSPDAQGALRVTLLNSPNFERIYNRNGVVIYARVINANFTPAARLN
ncbi:MAG: hypothetical protein AAF125_04805 [Chloroflexota bacterium]